MRFGGGGGDGGKGVGGYKYRWTNKPGEVKTEADVVIAVDGQIDGWTGTEEPRPNGLISPPCPPQLQHLLIFN